MCLGNPPRLAAYERVRAVGIARRALLTHELSLVHQLPCLCLQRIVTENLPLPFIIVIGRPLLHLLFRLDHIDNTTALLLVPLEAFCIRHRGVVLRRCTIIVARAGALPLLCLCIIQDLREEGRLRFLV